MCLLVSQFSSTDPPYFKAMKLGNCVIAVFESKAEVVGLLQNLPFLKYSRNTVFWNKNES